MTAPHENIDLLTNPQTEIGNGNGNDRTHLMWGVDHWSGTDRNIDDFLMENRSMVIVELEMSRLMSIPNVMAVAVVAVIPARAECKNRNR